jgi:hypothetical protein
MVAPVIAKVTMFSICHAFILGSMVPAFLFVACGV